MIQRFQPLQRVRPANLANGCIACNMKKRPLEYVAATYRKCRETGQTTALLY